MKLGFHAMDLRRDCMGLCFLLFYFWVAATLFTQCDARRSRQPFKFEGPTRPTSLIIRATKKPRISKHVDVIDAPALFDPSNTQPYGVNTLFALPPFDSLPPLPLAENNPPFCVLPPFTPQPPTTVTVPTPVIYTQPPPSPIQGPPSPPGMVPSPPEYSPTPNPPEYVPSPPSTVPSPPESVPSPPSSVPSPPETVPSPPNHVPGPPEYVPSPPEYGPSPPSYIPSPPEFVPSPGGFVPSPPVFQPPVVYPPPSVPPPRHMGPATPLWCVAKPSVPDPIIQEAMDYACGFGGECRSIQPDGSCFQPNTLYAHASYAFNSYWQRTKVAGGACDFGGTAILVMEDPSFDGCHYIYY